MVEYMGCAECAARGVSGQGHGGARLAYHFILNCVRRHEPGLHRARGTPSGSCALAVGNAEQADTRSKAAFLRGERRGTPEGQEKLYSFG